MTAAEGRAVGVDIGGTKLVGGLIGDHGVVIRRRRCATPAAAGADVARAAAELVGDLAAGAILPVGVGAAGMVDTGGVVRFAPNIAWRDYPLQTELSAHYPGPVRVDNDANAAAWGEYRVGAGKSAGASMVMLTVGTGVGGGLILADRLVRGREGLAAEFGHLVVAEGGPRCACGNQGCLEAVASGTAIGRLAREAVAEGRLSSGSASLAVAPETLNGKKVTAAAEAGDELAIAVVAEAGFWLGVGIASLVNAFDPELVVVGGGAMEAGALLLDPARASAAERIMGTDHRTLPPIVPATLADDAGIVGAALLALETTS